PRPHSDTHTHTHTHTQTHTHTDTHTQNLKQTPNTQTHTHTNADTHTHTHTHPQSQTHPPSAHHKAQSMPCVYIAAALQPIISTPHSNGKDPPIISTPLSHSAVIRSQPIISHTHPETGQIYPSSSSLQQLSPSS